jgi:4-aminobutyrate aminotransferase
LAAVPARLAESRPVPDIITELPGPKARAHVAFDETWTSPSLPRAYPIVPVRGDGLTVEDIDGNLFLDFAAGIAVTSTGHSHPQVVAAIREQAAELIHFSASDFYLPIYPEVCRRLAEITPVAGGKARVYLGNSGTEVVETAIKLARHATKRPYVVAFLGAFHGRSYGSVSLTASKAKYHAGFGPLLPGVFHAPFGRVDDLRWFEDVLFDKLAPANEVAAIIVEPIQGEGGYVVPEDGYLAGLREICDRHGIVLVFDEIQSGAGRTGTMWAAEQWDVKPDVVLSAKGIASGMPLGALIGRADLLESWGPGAHGSTYGGNPVACAAALATIDLLEGGLVENARVRGEQAFAGLGQLRSRFEGLITDVRGRGLMIGVEFDTAEHAEEVQWAAFQRGLLVLECGKTSVRMSPALTVSEAEMATALRIFGEAVGDVAGEHRKLHDAAEAAHAITGVEAAG